MSFTLIHRQVAEVLPWYVTGRLLADEAGRVEEHLSVCPACRSEAEGLSKMLSVHAASTPQREVDERKLDALFARIDRHEMERRQSPAASAKPWSELLSAAIVGIVGWLVARPVLVAGVFAVLFVTLLAVPSLQSPPIDPSYDVLGSKAPGIDELRIKLAFRNGVVPADVQRLVSSSLGADAATNTYRIEQRTPREYVVIFESKPGVATVSRLLEGWRSAPNVAVAAIDDSAAQK